MKYNAVYISFMQLANLVRILLIGYGYALRQRIGVTARPIAMVSGNMAFCIYSVDVGITVLSVVVDNLLIKYKVI